jgi:hypothetical protein
MMQPAESLLSKDPTRSYRTNPAVRCPFLKSEMRPVLVQDASTIVADDEEAIKHAERNRWHSEEIRGRNGFPMVSKKGQPALGPVRTSRRPLHPTGDSSLPKIKAEHAEFFMDPRCSPGWVLSNHLENQFPNLLRRLFPSNLVWSNYSSCPLPHARVSLQALVHDKSGSVDPCLGQTARILLYKRDLPHMTRCPYLYAYAASLS